MPNIKELEGLYLPGTSSGKFPDSVDPLFKTVKSEDKPFPLDVWSGQLKDFGSAHFFTFDCGNEAGLFKIFQSKGKSENMRALAVRPGKR